MAPPELTMPMVVVFAVTAAALVSFVAERLSPDVTALSVLVSLVVLEPWTEVDPAMAISGFASSATVTIMAMYMLSEGVQRTGAVQRLGSYLARVTGGDERRVLAATVGTTGPLAGFVNNTPVVAVFIPMITDLAEESHLSPSKFLIPLSYAAMLGGTLTLVGTATNIVASDLVATELVPGHGPIGMFELTPLGVVVLLVGVLYLLTVAPRLLPDRVPATLDVTDTYEVSDYLAQVRVRKSSGLVGQRVDEAFGSMELDVDVLQLVRDEEVFIAPSSDRDIAAGDVLTVRATLQDVNRFAESYGVRQLPREEVTGDSLSAPWIRGELVEIVVPPESNLADRTLRDIRFRERYGATVMAIRRGNDVIHERLGEVELAAGDSLLLYATTTAAELLTDDDEVLVTRGPADDADEKPSLSPKTPIAVGVLLAVVGLAAFTHFPIVVTALGGVVAMVVTGCLDIEEAYDAVSWNVVFLLAGILPLSAALRETGAAGYLADQVVLSAGGVSLLVVVGAFYLLTGLLANVITPVASVALLVPVAANAATQLGADPLSFVLAVTFAGSTAFMTPIGYQTNLMVYGPGGYRFTDYLRVGAPLQVLLAVVTTLGIGVLWPPGPV